MGWGCGVECPKVGVGCAQPVQQDRKWRKGLESKAIRGDFLKAVRSKPGWENWGGSEQRGGKPTGVKECGGLGMVGTFWLRWALIISTSAETGTSPACGAPVRRVPVLPELMLLGRDWTRALWNQNRNQGDMASWPSADRSYNQGQGGPEAFWGAVLLTTGHENGLLFPFHRWGSWGFERVS